MEPDRDFWAGKQVCVTGGTGFLGHHIVKQLTGLGAQVRVFALRPAAEHPLLKDPQVECIFADVLEPKAVRQATAGCAIIFHTAGPVAVWGPGLSRMHAVHMLGTRNLLKSAGPGTCVVHTSSIVALGASHTGEVLNEESPFTLDEVRIDYVHAKRAAERLALEAAAQGQHVVVTNPGFLVGPDDPERSVMGRFCVRFWKGRIPVAPPGGMNLVDVRDVARGHLLAAEHGRAARRYILGGANQTFCVFMALLAEAANLCPRALPRLPGWILAALAGMSTCRGWLTGREPYPAPQHVRLNRYSWFVSSERAARELGYIPRPLADSLADTYRWYAAQGVLALRGFNRWWMRPGSTRRQVA